VATNRDGTLTVNTVTLANAVANTPSAVQSFFQGSSANGFAASLVTTLNAYTDPTQGAFTVELSSISSANTDLTNQTNTLELYLTAQQASLTTEYNNADIALAQLPQTLKQVNALLNPNSTSSGS
jgi:flagellar hook-associated protein 2